MRYLGQKRTIHTLTYKGTDWAFLVVVGLGLIGCGDEPERVPREPEDEVVGQSANYSEGGRVEAPPEESVVETADVEEGSVFSLYCESSATIPVLDESLQSFHQKICADDQPTRLFAATLASKAFVGEADETPRVMKMAKTVNDSASQTTRVWVAAAVRLPINAERYFERVSLLAGDPDQSETLGLEQYLGMKSLVVEEELAHSHEAHVSGWILRILLEHTVSGQTIQSEYRLKTDNWVIAPGKVYAVTSTLDSSIKGVKGLLIYSIIVQVSDEEAYVFVQNSTTSKNHGLPQVAESTMIDIFRSGVINVFSNSVLVSD